MAIQVWMFIGMSKIIMKSLANKKTNGCSENKDCSALGVLISHVTISPVILVLVAFRLKKTTRCMNMIVVLLLRCRYSRRLPVASFAVLVLMISMILKIGVSLNYSKQIFPIVFYAFYASFTCPLLIVHLVSIMCLVSQNSYEDINREMGILCSLILKSERALRLTSLMNDHWFLEDFIEHISNTFGAELLFIMMDIYIQLLLCFFILIWENIVHKVNVDSFMYANVGIHICIMAGNLIYLCHRCNATVKESRRIIFEMHRLRCVLYDDPIGQAILKVFTLRVNSREVHIAVLKLFNINLPLLCGSASLMFTYFLVLVQFQIDGYKHSSRELNITKMDKCEKWPCISKGQ
ncbi:uncharacterized protein LOC126834980 [Adelges cooleyi]|uniref:uncharacterized protein LOC126834980 n=1 Tax=Adelges cooleyi TaxID=133065 RepID=UPI0021804059|nr:uncharacterized protein LOC126834980 [Adelges cooleyi]